MNYSSKAKIFLVGCPRSGTTLLQSIIASHPEIASFPESNLYLCLTAPNSRREKLGIASKGAKKAFGKFLTEIDRTELKSLLPKYAFTLQHYSSAFINTFDILAKDRGKNLWLEKTPYHLRRIYMIEKLVDRPKFIHIIRNGRDVIASLYEVTHQYPEIWGGAKDIQRCVREWLNDIQISTDYACQANHLLIRYEHLLQNPQTTVHKICNFIGIDYSDELLENRDSLANKIVKTREAWKNNITSPIKSHNSNKFYNIFSIEEQDYINNSIAKVGLDKIISF